MKQIEGPELISGVELTFDSCLNFQYDGRGDISAREGRHEAEVLTYNDDCHSCCPRTKSRLFILMKTLNLFNPGRFFTVEGIPEYWLCMMQTHIL